MNRIKKINLGFIEAMYFADGADGDFKDDDGHYMDGVFDEQLQLSDNALENVASIIQDVLVKLDAALLLELTDNMQIDYIGHNIYLDIMGHGVGFDDSNEISDGLKQALSDIIQYNYFVELFDDGEKVQFSYSVKGV